LDIIVPATSANLGPGFDSLGLALKLHNQISITPSKIASIAISGEGSDKPSILKNNAFVNIFSETFKRLVGKNENFKFKFQNNIPFSRGLGSSSAVIVGAIAAAYEMAGFKASRDKILDESLFYENHPDNISPATHGGFTANIVHENRVITQKCEISDEICAVVVIPNSPISTEKSRTLLPKAIRLADAVTNISHAAFIASCFFSRRYDDLKFGAKDTIHEAARMGILPELFEVREIALKNGAIFSTLSGSGSSFLNIIFRDCAQDLKQKLQSKFGEFRVEILEFDNAGFQILG